MNKSAHLMDVLCNIDVVCCEVEEDLCFCHLGEKIRTQMLHCLVYSWVR